MLNRKLVAFQTEWEKQFSWLSSASDKNLARCKICCKDFRLSNMGKSAVVSHGRSIAHQENVEKRSYRSKFTSGSSTAASHDAVPSTSNSMPGPLASSVTQTDFGWSNMVHSLQCPMCRFQTLRPSIFRDHCTSSHQDLKRVLIYSCPWCRALATDIRLIDEHKRLYHTNASLQSIAKANCSSQSTHSSSSSQRRSGGQILQAPSNNRSDPSPRRSTRLRRKSRSKEFPCDTVSSIRTSHSVVEVTTVSSSVQANSSNPPSLSSPDSAQAVRTPGSDSSDEVVRRTSRKSSIKAIAAMTAAIMTLTAPDSPISDSMEVSASPVKPEHSGRHLSPLARAQQQRQMESPQVAATSAKSSALVEPSVSATEPGPSRARKRRPQKRRSSAVDLTTSDDGEVFAPSAPPAKVKKTPQTNGATENRSPESVVMLNPTGRPIKRKSRNRTPTLLCSEVQSHIRQLYQRGITKPASVITEVRDFVKNELRPPVPIKEDDRHYIPSRWTVRRLMKLLRSGEIEDEPAEITPQPRPQKRRRVDLNHSHPLKSEPRTSNASTNSSRTFADLSSSSTSFRLPLSGSSSSSSIPISQVLLSSRELPTKQQQQLHGVAKVKLEETRVELVRCVKCGVRVPFQSDGTRASQDAALMAHLAASHGIRKRDPIVYPARQQPGSSGGHVTDLDAAELSPEETVVKSETCSSPTGDVRILKERSVRVRPIARPLVKKECGGAAPDLQVTGAKMCPTVMPVGVKRPPAEEGAAADVEVVTVRMRGAQPLGIKAVPRDEGFPVEEEDVAVDIDRQETKGEVDAVKEDVETEEDEGEDVEMEAVRMERGEAFSPEEDVAEEGEEGEAETKAVACTSEQEEKGGGEEEEKELEEGVGEREMEESKKVEEEGENGEEEAEEDGVEENVEKEEVENEPQVNGEVNNQEEEEEGGNEELIHSDVKILENEQEAEQEQQQEEEELEMDFGVSHLESYDGMALANGEKEVETEVEAKTSDAVATVNGVSCPTDDSASMGETAVNGDADRPAGKGDDLGADSPAVTGSLIVQDGEEEEHWQCDHCFAGFEDQEELRSHLMEIHGSTDAIVSLPK